MFLVLPQPSLLWGSQKSGQSCSPPALSQHTALPPAASLTGWGWRGAPKGGSLISLDLWTLIWRWNNNDPRLLETLRRLNDLMHIKRLDLGPKQALHNCWLVFYRSKKILLAFIQPVLLLFTKKGVVAPQFFYGFLPILHLFHTVTWFPTVLAPGTGFVEDNFSTCGGSGVEGMVSG